MWRDKSKKVHDKRKQMENESKYSKYIKIVNEQPIFVESSLNTLKSKIY